MSLHDDGISQLLNTYLPDDLNGVNPATDCELGDSDSQHSLSTISVSELVQEEQQTTVETLDRKPDLMFGDDFPGTYNFEIGFEPQKKIAKSITWTYSESLSKLYADMGKPCPILFRVTAPETGAALPCVVIRCLPTYVSPVHQLDPVVRCPNHTAVQESSSCEQQQAAPPSHFIRCDDKDTCYHEDKATGQQSVTVPYRHQGWMPVVYRFMCFSSCVGNLGRRQIQAIFTLESMEGIVLGRRTIELRICACPGRDRRSDESTQKQKVVLKRAVPASCPVAPSVGKVAKTDDDVGKVAKTNEDQVFYLKVHGAENFGLLSRINEALELSQSVKQQQQQQQQQHCGKADHIATIRTKNSKNTVTHRAKKVSLNSSVADSHNETSQHQLDVV